ncbi:hypothetical protein ACB098_11G017100 [Castanea mollissima]
MKLSFIRGCFPSNLSIFVKPSICTNLLRPACFSSMSSPPTSLKPQIPLFLRPPLHSASVSDLRKWHDWAKKLASSVGSTFLDSDDGTDSGLLCRELKWLMEEAIEDHTVFSQMGIENNQTNVRLRTGIEELYNLWKQRIEERRPFQPETKLNVDLVADVVSNNEGLREGLWADLGTGSGALAIGIGRILGSCGRVIATALSPVALSVAAFNVQKYGLQDVIELRQGSWFKPLKDAGGKLAGIVSNPSYIPSDNIPGLQAEVGRHEPRLALDGGLNGMDDHLHLCNGVALMLRPGGFFIFETNGEKQCKCLAKYIENDIRGGFHKAGFHCNICPPLLVI